MRRLLLPLLAVPMLAGCSLLGDGYAPATPVAADVLRPGDGLRITVAGEEQISGFFTVQQDRTVHMELLGNVPAGGLGLAAFEDVLRRKLADGYLKDPQVLVARADPQSPVPAPADAVTPAAAPALRKSQLDQ